MNKEQWEGLNMYFLSVYNLSEKLEDMNEEIGDPDIDKALELIINGLDLICDVLERNEGKK